MWPCSLPLPFSFPLPLPLPLPSLLAPLVQIAICDQLEDAATARRRGAKTIRRAVTRLYVIVWLFCLCFLLWGGHFRLLSIVSLSSLCPSLPFPPLPSPSLLSPVSSPPLLPLLLQSDTRHDSRRSVLTATQQQLFAFYCTPALSLSLALSRSERWGTDR